MRVKDAKTKDISRPGSPQAIWPLIQALGADLYLQQAREGHRQSLGNGGTNLAEVATTWIQFGSRADTFFPDDGPVKDKAFRRYASNVERSLTLFDTTLQEWPDYISFLGRLLKVCDLVWLYDPTN